MVIPRARNKHPAAAAADTSKQIAFGTHWKIISKSYQINPKSDCNYHFSIDFDPNGRPLDPNQTENGYHNLISSWFNKIAKIFLRVYKANYLDSAQRNRL